MRERCTRRNRLRIEPTLEAGERLGRADDASGRSAAARSCRPLRSSRWCRAARARSARRCAPRGDPAGSSRVPSSACSRSASAPSRSSVSRLRARSMARLHALGVERFQQVVDGVDLERLDRVLVERGDENDGRHPVGADAMHHVEPAAARASGRRAAPGPAPATRLQRSPRRRDPHSPATSISGAAPSAAPDAQTDQRLIVDDQHSQGAPRSVDASVRSKRSGSVIRTWCRCRARPSGRTCGGRDT